MLRTVKNASNHDQKQQSTDQLNVSQRMLYKIFIILLLFLFCFSRAGLALLELNVLLLLSLLLLLKRTLVQTYEETVLLTYS